VKLEEWRNSPQNKNNYKADVEAYSRYRERWEAGGKKAPLLPFVKWREGRYK
jgi:hypothetical protein